MSNSEAERQFYLSMAGIQVWYARGPLPGSAPSPEFNFPQEQAPREITGPEPAAALAPARVSRKRPQADPAQAGERIANLQALMADKKPAETSVAEPAPVAEPVPVAESETVRDPASAGAGVDTEVASESVGVEAVSVAGLRVTLGFWAAGDVVMISGISEDASDRLQESLATNIISALGRTGQVATDYLRWPVFANPLVPGNSFSDFSRLLKGMGGDLKDRQLILLGVLPEHLAEGREHWLASTLGMPAVDSPHTLAELAAVPAYKRALWQQLKPLVRGQA